MEKRITFDILAPLGGNIQTAFRILHPDGITVEELSEKSRERNFYRGIYQYIERVAENELCVQF